MKVRTCDSCNKIINHKRISHVEIVVWMAHEGEKWQAYKKQFCTFDCTNSWFNQHEIHGFTVIKKK